MSSYKTLSQEEQDDIIVSFFLQQERDKYCHELNLARYDNILKTTKDGNWKNKISSLRSDTIKRLAEVNSIVDATQGQLPPPDRLDLAKKRLKASKGMNECTTSP